MVQRAPNLNNVVKSYDFLKNRGDILAGTVSIRTIRPFCTTNQAKDIANQSITFSPQTHNNKTYFELSALHYSILCIYITSHSFGVNVVAMDFFGNKKCIVNLHFFTVVYL